MGRLFATVPPLAATSRMVCNTLPLAFLVVFTLQAQARRPPRPDIFPVFLCVGLVGFALYLLFPALRGEHLLHRTACAAGPAA